MADYFTNFSLIVSLPSVEAKAYALQLADQASQIQQGDEQPESFPEDLKSVVEDWCFETNADIRESAGIQSIEPEQEEKAIDAASGLTTIEAENAFALSFVQTRTIEPVVVGREKAQAVKKNGLLEIIEAKETLANIGGLDVLKTWLDDVFCSGPEDPSIAPARKMDWEAFVQKLDECTKAIVLALTEGDSISHLSAKFKLSATSLQNRKQKLAVALLEFMGVDVLVESTCQPAWRDGIVASIEKSACWLERSFV